MGRALGFALIFFVISQMVGKCEGLPPTTPSSSSTGNIITNLNSSNFDTLTTEGIWIVEFYAEWCGVCRKFNSIFDKTSLKYKNKIHFARVNVDDQISLSTRFLVSSIPTLFLIDSASGLVYQLETDLNEAKFIDSIENQNWLNSDPLNGFFAPNSPLMFGLFKVVDFGQFSYNALADLLESYSIPRDYASYILFACVFFTPLVITIFLNRGDEANGKDKQE